MTASLSLETKAIVKATAPALQQHGVAITTRMYERLFTNPEVRAMFDQAAQASGEQPRFLAMRRISTSSKRCPVRLR